MKTLKTRLAVAALLAWAGAAHATLVTLGDGTVKDTGTNLIWLQNWNVNGGNTWDTQTAWADGLVFAGSTQWRLPTMSEYAALFDAYGNGDLTQVTAFVNMRRDIYWSSTETSNGARALGFGPDRGYQGGMDKDYRQLAVAVRIGDVTVTTVPEPQTLAMALLALGAAALTRTRRPS